MLPTQNIVYTGVENPVTVVLEKTSCDSIKVRSDRGSISGKGCTYIYKVAEKGPVRIVVSKKKNGKWIKVGDEYLRAVSLPDPTPSIGITHSGTIRQKLLIACGGMIAPVLNISFELSGRIDSFAVCIVRNEACPYNSIQNVGARFNDNVIAAFQSLKVGDNVIFMNIYSRYLGHSVELAPFILVISNE